MKKVVCLLCALIVALSACAYAANDLLGLSFEELLQKQEQINLALWASDGWQEVEVPVGVYFVGKDIPVGTWVVKTRGKYMCFEYGFIEDGAFSSYHGGHEMIDGIETNGDTKEIVYQAIEGQAIQISYAPAIFCPYVPAFKFK